MAIPLYKPITREVAFKFLGYPVRDYIVEMTAVGIRLRRKGDAHVVRSSGLGIDPECRRSRQCTGPGSAAADPEGARVRVWSDDAEQEADDEAFFGPWAEAMVKAEVSRGMLDQMWNRIKIKLDDLHKVEQLLIDTFGPDGSMVDEK
jgi:hypothetical protein